MSAHRRAHCCAVGQGALRSAHDMRGVSVAQLVGLWDLPRGSCRSASEDPRRPPKRGNRDEVALSLASPKERRQWALDFSCVLAWQLRTGEFQEVGAAIENHRAVQCVAPTNPFTTFCLATDGPPEVSPSAGVFGILEAAISFSAHTKMASAIAVAVDPYSSVATSFRRPCARC